MSGALLVCTAALAATWIGVVVLLRQRGQLARRSAHAVQQAFERACHDTTRQLSHDMRSPLAALETVLAQRGRLHQQDRVLIVAAATRMRDMANTTAALPEDTAQAEPLLLELEYTLSHVRQQRRHQPAPHIELTLDPTLFTTAFTPLSRTSLHTLMAGEIDRCVAAAPVSQVLVVRCDQAHVNIHNTTSGSVRAVRVPRIPAPPWFASIMAWAPGSTVVIVDDDDAVHAAWDARLSAMPAHSAPGVKHFTTLADLEQQVQSTAHDAATNYTYWVDHEFAGSPLFGLDVIERLGIGAQSTLVTSHYDDSTVRARCLACRTRILPKTLLHSVPLQQQSIETAVLIDDDTLVHQVWQMAARGRGRLLKTFSQPQGFFEALESFARSTPVYVDAQLGDGVKGEEVARSLHARGFSSLYLTTGLDPRAFPDMPWIKGILGKDPPF